MPLKKAEKATKIAALQEAIERMLNEPATDGRIPTERELAGLLGCSRHQVRQALDRLEAEGRISRHVGRGTYVGEAISEGMSDFANLALYASPREIAEARQLIEPQLAMLAAMRATTKQLKAIEVHTKHCMAARNLASYEVADEQFHRSIAAATGNVALKAMFDTLNEARRKIVLGKMRRAGLTKERRELYSMQHQRICDAILNRDPEEAAAAMRAHMDIITELYTAFELMSAGKATEREQA